MNNFLPPKEFDLDFPIEKIETTIDQIISVSVGSYQLQDKNPLLHTFRFSIMEGLNPSTLEITLKKIDASKTKCIFQMVAMYGSMAPVSAMNRMLDDFLKILTKGLSGEEVNRSLISTNKTGCLGILTFTLFVLIVILFLTSCK